MAAPIWVFTGNEGSGKTADMTFWSLRHLALGGKVHTFPGYSIHHKKQPDKLYSCPLDVREWLTMPKSYKSLVVDIQEMQNFLDSFNSSSVFGKVVYRVLAQRRKLDMGVMYDTQNWAWIHPRIRWLTHLYSTCSDLYHTHWGKSEGLGRGRWTLLTTYDCKGFYTGQAWRLLSRKMINIYSTWDFYQSFDSIDPFIGETKYNIKRHQEYFDLRSAEEIERAAQHNYGMVKSELPGEDYTSGKELDSYKRHEEAVAEGTEENDRIFNRGDLGLLERAAQAGMKPRDLSKMQSALMKDKKP